MSVPSAVFTLAQKVYAVGTYYRNDCNMEKTMTSIHSRYGIAVNAHNMKTISVMMNTFEQKGTVLDRYTYNNNPDKGMPIVGVLGPSGVIAAPPVHVKTPAVPVVVEKEVEEPIEFNDDEEDYIIEEYTEEPLKADVGEGLIYFSETGGDEQEYEVLAENTEVEFSAADGESTGIDEEDEEEEEGDEHDEDYEEKDSRAGKEQRGVGGRHSMAKRSSEPAIPGHAPVLVKNSKEKIIQPPAIRIQECKVCHEKLPSRNMPTHMAEHNKRGEFEEGTLTCDVCKLEFPTRDELADHRRNHFTTNEHYICEVCGKVSASKSTHKNHMLCHSDEKPYACDQCPMRFRRRQGWRRHIMSHNGEKPLVCKVCGQGFLAHMTLNMHMRLHTGERPYPCEHCEKRFIGRPALNAHLKKHHKNEYLFECGICNTRCKTAETLRDHMTKRHDISRDEELVPKIEGDE